MPTTLNRWVPLAVLALATLAWRSVDLAARPMHADEANQAVKAGELLESGRYAYDPGDHHGPVLYYATLPVAWARGQHTLASLDEVTVRLVPVVAGSLSVLLLGILASPLGRWPSLAAAAFLAASPPSVYYGRYYIQETLLVTFTLAALLCIRSWWRTGSPLWAVAAGAFFGLMLASKESAPVLAILALVAVLVSGRPPLPEGRRVARDVLLFAAAATGVALVFYSSFGTHPAGIGDFLSGYRGNAARLASGDTGQEKPWGYYLGLLTYERRGNLVFEERAFAILALVGIAIAFRGTERLLRWAAVYTLLLAVVLSATPYKTPWNVIHLIPALAILAAGALASVSRNPSGAGLAAGAALAVLALLVFQADRVSRVYPADPRNPFAYVHSTPDVLKIRSMAEEALRRHPGGVVRVISEDYWPIPWYLRGLGKVGYWNQVPAECDGALVIASADLAGPVKKRLNGAYDSSYLGLRPGFVLEVFTRNP